MKHTIAIGLTLLTAGSLLAADSPKDTITGAAKKLAGKENYSWHTSTVVPADAQFSPGPMDGKIEKDGFTHITWEFFDNSVRIIRKDGKAAYEDQDGYWQLASEGDQGDGPGRWMSVMARNIPIPAKQVVEIVEGAKELKQDGDAYSSDLTETGAKQLMTFNRDGGGPAISDAKGSVKIWVKDGELTKYEYKVEGLMDFNGNEWDIDRTTTIEIKDVGTTKVKVPEEALKKLEP